MFVLAVLLFCGVLIYVAHQYVPWFSEEEVQTATTTPVIASFEDCRAAGLPVMESHPRQCRTTDGRVYAEEIQINPTYTNASADRIQVELPTPGSVTGKTFTVMGKARGNWFFEASFPVEVRDTKGELLASTHAEAKGDWMTEEFVPFTAEVSIPEAFIGSAVLILRRDNASGLPEHAASISIPLTIEY